MYFNYIENTKNDCILLSTIISICLWVWSCKRTCFHHVDRHVGRSLIWGYSCNLQGTAIVKITNSRDMWTWIEIQTAKNSAETIHIWNTESRTNSARIWYSRFTITIRNIFILIPLLTIVQIIQASCTHACNMQIVHLAYDHHVLTVTCKSSIWVFNHHVTIPASCEVSTIQLSCINSYVLQAYGVIPFINNYVISMH